MLREVATRYGRAPGGYLWAVIEPLGTLLIVSAAFSLLLRNPSLGDSFILFYAAAFLPFNVFSGIAHVTMQAIAFSRPLLRFPTVGWIDALMARFILNALTLLLVSYVLVLGILWATGTRTLIDLPPVLAAFGLSLLLGFGVGAFNCAVQGLFPIYGTLWGIVTRPLMLASAILFIVEDLPKFAQTILWFNPLVHITGLSRAGFYPVYAPTYLSQVYVLLCALVPMALGLLLLRRHHLAILNR